MGGGQSIGKVIAVEFAEQGAQTVICSRPRPVAKTALFLASPDTDHVSCAALSVNGGISFP
jgi:NAD(P)-dependent dehydrogenase (short-subunit alcohol dehydrogenase family)